MGKRDPEENLNIVNNLGDKKQDSSKKKLTLKEIGPRNLVIILMCGVLLIILSIPGLFSGNKKTNTQKSVTTGNESTKKATNNVTEQSSQDIFVSESEKKLKAILKKVEGIGDVEVMITVKSSKELVPLKDTPSTEEHSNETDSQGGSRQSSNVTKSDETVTVSNGNGETVPYVVKELEPEVKGVVVIAQGGGDVTIISEIVEAVQVLFDVPAHKIKVMKMN